MYIFKNAWLSITRNKGRNVLIGIIILVISLCATVTLAIRNSANKLIDSYKDAYQIEATISFSRKNVMESFDPTSDNRDEIMEKFSEASSLTIDDINNYGDSKYVTSYYYTTTANVNSNTIEKASSSVMKKNSDSYIDSEQRKMPSNFIMSDSSTDFQLVGYSSYEAMNDFITGSYTINEGEVSSDFTSNNCVINSELATLNNISVGDTITFVNSDDETSTYNFVVTGIYSDNEESEGMQMFSNSANKIITSSNAVLSLDNLEVTNSPTYVLTSKDVIEKFSDELTEKGLSEYLEISTNLDNIENEIRSISNLKTYVTTFLIITLVIGIVVLFVINMINIRERKYEIGVLRTIGMKKSILSLQFVFETLIITVFALIIGTGIGTCLSVPVANAMLENEIASSSESMNNINNNFGGNMSRPNESSLDGNRPNMKFAGQVSIDKISSINAAVDITVLLELLAIGILLAIISSSAAMISVQRFRPLTILKERS